MTAAHETSPQPAQPAAETGDAILVARSVSKRFGEFTALKSIDIAVQPGTIHAIIGPNGAGKTTFFNILTGQLPPTSGTIEVEGASIERLGVHERVQRGLARCFQVTSVFGGLTVRENVRLAAQGRRPRRAFNFLAPVRPNDEYGRRADEVLERIGLADLSDRYAAEISHGQQRLLEVGIAIAPKPTILLLDEPTSGMGVDDVPVMEHLLDELRGEYTIVMIEHNMALTMRVADRIAVLLGGEILLDGKPEEVRSDERVRQAYLGTGSTSDEPGEANTGTGDDD